MPMCMTISCLHLSKDLLVYYLKELHYICIIERFNNQLTRKVWLVYSARSVGFGASWS